MIVALLVDFKPKVHRINLVIKPIALSWLPACALANVRFTPSEQPYH